MRKYCVVLIGFIMLMPFSELRASEATMVASLSIVERAISATHETVVVLPQDIDDELRITWGTPQAVVIARSTQGGSIEQIAVAGQRIDFSNMENLQEVSVY